MALSIYNVKKWYRMLTGKSVMHVNQNLGRIFSTSETKGYYNNLTEKVLMLPELLESDRLPVYAMPSGKNVTFPVDIFQYGLGAYDLYLLIGDKRYLEKFKQCCQWTVDHQESSGAWCNFFFKYPDNPYGAMAQGEAASLLIRAYKEFGDETFLKAAESAIDFMLLPLDKGGTTIYTHKGEVFLCEYTHLPVVLNGWIFAYWGLYDYVLITEDDKEYSEALSRTENTLADNLSRFSQRHWSLYDLNKKMTSPFYHRLHIAQMQAMYRLTGRDIYRQYAEKWEDDLNNPLWKTTAFIHKVWQKINEKEAWA